MAACCCINNLVLLENPSDCSIYTIFLYYMSDSPYKSRILMTRRIPTMAMTMKTKCATHHNSSPPTTALRRNCASSCLFRRPRDGGRCCRGRGPVEHWYQSNGQNIEKKKHPFKVCQCFLPPFSMELCSSAQPSWQLLCRYRPSATGKSCSLNVSSQNGPWKSTKQLDTTSTKQNC